MNIIRKMILDKVSERKENNAMILCVGDTGSAKSTACNYCGEKWDENFSINNVAFMTATNFMKVINSPKIKRGSVVVWDDAGQGLKSDEWYKTMNRAVRDVLQTFRIDGLIVFVNCPDPSFIDKKVLKLFDYWMEAETDSIDYANNRAYFKFYIIQKNRKSGKIYWHRPRYRDSNGKLRVVNHLVTGLTSEVFEKKYKKRKKDANRLIKINAEKRIKMEEDNETRKLETNEDIVKQLLVNIKLYSNTYNGRHYIDPYTIMGEYNIGLRRATSIKKIIENSEAWKKYLDVVKDER